MLGNRDKRRNDLGTSTCVRSCPPCRLLRQALLNVLVPVALDRAYTYRLPPDLDLAPGDLVHVPLGPRLATGVVWTEHVEVKPGLHNRLRDVEEKLDLPPLRPELRGFVDWVAQYTLAPRGEACCGWRCAWASS